MVQKNNTKKATTPNNGKPIPAAKPTAPPAKASIPTANNSNEPQSILNAYMQIFDEAADFAKESVRGNVPVQLATEKAVEMIKKMISLGLRSAHHYG